MGPLPFELINTQKNNYAMGNFTYTEEQLLQELIDFNNTHGRPPAISDFGHRSKTFRHRFGSWNNALIRAGICTFEYPNKQNLNCDVCNTQYTRPSHYKKHTNNFCSRKCKDHHDQTSLEYKSFRKEIGTRVFSKIKENIPKYCYISFITCKVCNKLFSVRSSKQANNKTCSTDCQRVILSQSGLKVYTYNNKRSKNEISLGEILSYYYPDILYNEPMFNGWDADIIIPSLKLAILWNGAWHYTKITKKHSLPKVQNRDQIKMKEILKANFSFIVIKDFKNKMTPSRAAQTVVDLIQNRIYNCSIY